MKHLGLNRDMWIYEHSTVAQNGVGGHMSSAPQPKLVLVDI